MYYSNEMYHGKRLLRTKFLVLSSLRELPRRGRPAHDHQCWQSSEVLILFPFFRWAQRVRDGFTPNQNLAIFLPFLIFGIGT